MTKSDLITRKKVDEESKREIMSHLSTMNKDWDEAWASSLLTLLVINNDRFPSHRHIHEVLREFFNATYYDEELHIANSTPLAHVKAFNKYRDKWFKDSPKDEESSFERFSYNLETGEGCTIGEEEGKFSVDYYLYGVEMLFEDDMRNKTFSSNNPIIADTYKRCLKLYKRMTGKDWVYLSEEKNTEDNHVSKWLT